VLIFVTYTLRFDTLVLRVDAVDLISVMDELMSAMDTLIDALRIDRDTSRIIIDDVFASVDALKDNVELLKVFTVEPRFDTDVLSDKTGRIKYLFNKYKDFALRSTLAAIIYILILNNLIIIHKVLHLIYSFILIKYI
jgi:hypothetical protein